MTTNTEPSTGDGPAPGRVDPEYLVDLLSRAIAYPTPVTEAGETDDQVLGFLEELVASELERLGLDMVDFDEMGNVCGRMNGSERSHPSTLLVGFAMTHPAGAMPNPFVPTIVDGAELGVDGNVVVGRGAGEQKGPLAALMASLETLIRSDDKPKSDIHFVCLASGETGRHDAIRAAMDHFRLEPAGAVVGVCTSNQIVIGHKGRADVEIQVHGRTSHSSSPDLGVNALEGAVEVLNRLKSLDLGDPDPNVGRRTIAPVALETSPNAPHTIPDLARIKLDCRLLPGDTPDDVLSQLVDVLSGMDGFQVDLELGDVMYPSHVSPDSWLVTSLVSAVEQASGSTPSLTWIPAATDSGFLTNHGIPAVLFGPGDIAKAHTDADFVSVEEAATAAQALVHLLTE